MDYNIELGFVKKCIKQEYQDRVFFELQSKKRREKAISRFSHSPETILKNDFVKCTISNLQNLLKKESLDKCYIISGDLYDGETLLPIEAIEYCKVSYMAVILISSKFVVVKEELEKGEADFWIYIFN